MELHNPQDLLNNKEFFDNLQQAYRESIVMSNDCKARIAKIMDNLDEDKIEEWTPLFELAATCAYHVQEAESCSPGPEKDIEWMINHMLSVAIAGGISTFMMLGTSRALQVADVIMKLNDAMIEYMNRYEQE